ncbi:MAG: class I poly(R)-hydroxyalkanoic acid synthase [Gammaproteobacteria bacterium]|nr:class I poly(R)-hydroxyalkanoic acid synthase [Gammaproteobacteria bacterium]
MSNDQTVIEELPPADSVTAAVEHIAEASHAAIEKFLNKREHSPWRNMDPLGLGEAFLQLTSRLMTDPHPLLKAQHDLWSAYARIWQNTALSFMGMPGAAHVPVPQGDKRFKHDDWENNPFFAFLKQSYLVTASTLQTMVSDVDGLDEKTARKIEFYTKQFADAIAPTNFALTNPEVLRTTVETGGANLLNGLRNFLADLDPETGQLRTRMTDVNAFELGRNVATTPGKVVFQNRMMQLLQYSPSTTEVYRRPLLIVPPWINKFYILDLQPKNSFIKWAVDQGHTVFVMSWINPDESLAEQDFRDYMMEGPLAALDAIEQATGERQVNIIGYCIGGTLLSALLAYMKAKGDDRIVSATFFTTLLDFSDPGDLCVFIDDAQLASLEHKMAERGYLDGSEMASTFNMLRANDLIWSFVINNYLLGKDPFPFDLLYWNSDSTRMPAKMHSTYLRTMYLENRFCQPGGMTVDGVPIDLRTIETPSCFIATIDDHIAPWKASYQGAQLFSGPVKFILGKSGHIAGIVNPPVSNKYGYSLGGDIHQVAADEWYTSTEGFDGSWWPAWSEWVAGFSPDMVPARQPGDGSLQVIEDAPGSYVRVRS